MRYSNFGLVYHSADVPYVFGSLENATIASSSLSTNMMDYWISFSVSSTPNDDHGNTLRESSPSLVVMDYFTSSWYFRTKMGTVHKRKPGLHESQW